MQSLLHYKDSGNKKLAQQKFSSAISDFSHVINELKITGIDEAQMVMICLINRSTCNLMSNKPDEAFSDANEAMKTYNLLRDPIDTNKINADKLKDDKLTIPLAISYVRRGQVYEARAEFHKAILDYNISDKINPNADGYQALTRIFKKLNIVDINQQDPDLKLFTAVYQTMTDQEKVVEALSELLQTLLDHPPAESHFSKFSAQGCARLIFGIMQIYMNIDIVVVLCISINRLLAENGVKDAFNGFPVIRTAMDVWKDNEAIVGDCLRFLELIPTQFNEKMIEGQIVPTIINAINVELQPEEYDIAFIIIYRLSSTKEQLKEIGTSNIIEIINKTKTLGGLILLSKLFQVPNLVRLAQEEGAMEWVVEKLNENKTNASIISAASIVLAQTFLHGRDTSNQRVQVVQSEEEENARKLKFTKTASQTISILGPISKKNNKDATIVSNCFAAIASCVELSTKDVRNERLIQAASAMLELHMANESCVMNLVSFFFACTQCDLKADVKANPSVFPTVMKALQKHPSNQLLAERAVAIAAECEHKIAEDLVALGLRQFPESAILRKYVGIINMERFKQ